MIAIRPIGLLAADEGGLLQARAASTPESMNLVGEALLSLLTLHRPKEHDHDPSA
jgi:hypothetical protein